MTTKRYTVQQFRCKLVKDGSAVTVPVQTIGTADAAALLFRDYYERLALPHERLMAALLDGRNRLLGLVRVSEGGLHGAAVTAADVLRPAIVAGASGIILSHNHPSGDPYPSVADVNMTRAIHASCQLMGVVLLDHVIVARGGAFKSLHAMGILDDDWSPDVES